MIKQYWLFAGDTYYPAGGMDDYENSFDNIEDAIGQVYHIKCDWWHIVDSVTKEIVNRGHRG